MTAVSDAGIAVHVVAMKRRHVRAVVRLETQLYPRPWSSTLFMSELALGATRSYFVAKVGRDLVGYAGSMFVADEGHITTIGVDPRLRRNGIATRLMLALVRDAVARGVRALTLEVRVSNHAARDLYRRFGFVPVGVRKHYYADRADRVDREDRREDALVMWARDVDAPEYSERLAAIEGRIAGATVFEMPGRS